MALNGRNIREQILGLLRRKDYRPLNKIDIARKLGLTGAEGVALRKSLRELERAGEIARIRKNRYVLPAEADLVTGKLSFIKPATDFSHQKYRATGRFYRRRKHRNSHARRPCRCADIAG